MTLSYAILKAHKRRIRRRASIPFRCDRLLMILSYVGICKRQKQADLRNFPFPYTLTNCQIRCAPVGERSTDDHVVSDSPLRKSTAGITFPHILRLLPIHAGNGRKMRSDDSGFRIRHTRYGALRPQWQSAKVARACKTAFKTDLRRRPVRKWLPCI